MDKILNTDQPDRPDRPGEVCYSFCISIDLTQMANFATWIPMTLTVLFLELFLSSDASTCSTMDLPPLGNPYHVVVSVSIDIP